MPRALIIGGRGQCGLAIGRRLVEAGWTVTATASGTPPAPEMAPGFRWLTMARNETDDLGASVPGEFEVVIDNVAFNAKHAEQLIALGDRVGNTIVVSTLSVYTDQEGRSLDTAVDAAGFPDWPVPIPAGWPTLSPGEGYSAGKAGVEVTLRASAPWPATIIRPGAIHGPGSRHLREWYFIKRVLDGRRQVVLPYGGNKVFQPTATVNLAELVSLAATRPGDRTLDCGDFEAPTAGQISETIDGLMGYSTERVVVEGPEPALNVGNHPWAVPRSAVVDMARAVGELGYRQPMSYAEAMAGTLAWALGATTGREWREVFPGLAAYSGDLFNYAAEDEYLKST